MATLQQNMIGPQVRRLRMAAGLTQEDFAAKLQRMGWDLSRAGLSKIEASLRRVIDAELCLLADALNCDLPALFPPRKTKALEIVRQGRL